MDTTKSNFLIPVKNQYEEHPYPPREPENEKNALITTETDFLGKISHYCFKGRFEPGSNTRVLVAGGGTGDALIFLAQQLKAYNTEVVYLDLSTASMEVARKRAQVRGLDNIQWEQGSLLDLPDQELGPFDYINCCGVLHHLEDPTQGLQALKGCLKEGGAIGVMVYAKYGRTGVYHMQELMRLVNSRHTTTGANIDNLRRAIRCLPETHCLKSGPIPLTDAKAAELADADLVDLFLHSQDRPYTVNEIYAWLAGCGLNLVDFVCNKPLYEPSTHITDSSLLKKITALPKRTQQSISEILVSTIYRHVFYASQTRGAETIASIDDSDNIPYFCDMLPLTEQATRQLQGLIGSQPEGSTMRLHFPMGNSEIMLPIGRLTKYLVKRIDGKTTTKNIIKSVKCEPELAIYKLTNKVVTSEFRKLYNFLNRSNVVLLRSKKVRPYKTLPELQTH